MKTFVTEHRIQFGLTPRESVWVRWRGDDNWSVYDSTNGILNAVWDFETEPMVSGRTDDFHARTRFKKHEAMERARSMAGWLKVETEKRKLITSPGI